MLRLNMEWTFFLDVCAMKWDFLWKLLDELKTFVLMMCWLFFFPKKQPSYRGISVNDHKLNHFCGLQIQTYSCQASLEFKL